MLKQLLIVCHNYYPASTADAVRMCFMVDTLSEDFQITVLCSSGGEARSNEKVISMEVNPIMPSSFLGRIRSEVQLYRKYWNLLKRKSFDAYMVSSPPYLSFLLLRWKLKKRSVNLINDMRDPYPFILGIHPAIQFIISRIELKLMRSALLNVFSSKSYTQYHRNTNGGLKFLYVPNGHTMNTNPPLNQFNTALRIVVLGNIGKMQDNDSLARLIKNLTDEGAVEFSIIGSGSEYLDLKNKCAGIDHCTFFGRIPTNEVEAFLQKADLGLSLRKENSTAEWIEPVRCFEYIGNALPQIIMPKNSFSQELYQKGIYASARFFS